jgi:hypothetical protein
MSPEFYLLDLLSEMEAVSLSEAIRAFEGDGERLRHWLLIYLDKRALVFEDGCVPLPECKAAEFLREPEVFETRGDVTITLSPCAVALLEEGKWERFEKGR